MQRAFAAKKCSCAWRIVAAILVSVLPATDIDPTKKPKEIDFKCGDMAFLGIYELNGDTLQLCLSTNGVRPTTFDSKQGLLSLLKRSKE